MTYFSAPNMQMTYADVEGCIGFQAVGLIPVRPRSSGLFPVPGWTDENEWSGYVAFEDMPWVKNPQKGYIVAANNLTVTPNYPYVIDPDASPGYRARRILEMIDQGGTDFIVEDIRPCRGMTCAIQLLRSCPF